jgi:hypothetical protein
MVGKSKRILHIVFEDEVYQWTLALEKRLLHFK